LKKFQNPNYLIPYVGSKIISQKPYLVGHGGKNQPTLLKLEYNVMDNKNFKIFF
jgi:hypothetical protein